MLQEYLANIGLDEKEQRIYLMLVDIGVQPASTIARKCKLDRVTTYKHLKRMATLGLVKVYYDHAIQKFGIENFDVLKDVLKEREKKTKELIDQFPTVEDLLTALSGHDKQFVPKLQFFEGEQGIRRCFTDVIFEASEQHIQKIRFLTTNTFEEQLGDVPLSHFVGELFTDIKKKGIDVEVYEASGTLIPERLHQVDFSQLNPEKLPAARGATHIMIVGQVVYISCFKTSQIALKICHSEISQVFHFLFDLLGKQREEKKCQQIDAK